MRKPIIVGKLIIEGTHCHGHLYDDDSVRVFACGDYTEGTKHVSKAFLEKAKYALKAKLYRK